MGPNDQLGVGGDVPPGQEAVRLLDPAGTFATDDPYLLADATSLIAPLPFEATESDTYVASDGTLQSSWGAVAPYIPPLDQEIPFNAITNQGIPVTFNGAYVTHD